MNGLRLAVAYGSDGQLETRTDVNGGMCGDASLSVHARGITEATIYVGRKKGSTWHEGVIELTPGGTLTIIHIQKKEGEKGVRSKSRSWVMKDWLELASEIDEGHHNLHRLGNWE